MSRSNRRRKPARKGVALRSILRSVGRGLAALSVAGVMFAAGWWLNQALTVQTWQIHGVSEPLEIAMEEKLKELQPLDLMHAWPSHLRTQLLNSLPDLAEVNIARHLPDKLEINATMRMPIALWRNGRGPVQLVDGLGVAYRPLKAGETLDLPFLRVPSDELDEAMVLLLKLKQMDVSRYTQLSEWVSETGGWKLNFERGRCWLLPHGELAGERMKQVLALMRDDRWKHGDWRIDVRADTRWFIRKSKLGGMV